MADRLNAAFDNGVVYVPAKTATPESKSGFLESIADRLARGELELDEHDPPADPGAFRPPA